MSVQLQADAAKRVKALSEEILEDISLMDTITPQNKDGEDIALTDSFSKNAQHTREQQIQNEREQQEQINHLNAPREKPLNWTEMIKGSLSSLNNLLNVLFTALKTPFLSGHEREKNIQLTNARMDAFFGPTKSSEGTASSNKGPSTNQNYAKMLREEGPGLSLASKPSNSDPTKASAESRALFNIASNPDAKVTPKSELDKTADKTPSLDKNFSSLSA